MTVRSTRGAAPPHPTVTSYRKDERVNISTIAMPHAYCPCLLAMLTMAVIILAMLTMAVITLATLTVVAMLSMMAMLTPRV